MKSPATASTADMLQKIEAIEKQVIDLKLSVLKNMTPSKQKAISQKTASEPARRLEPWVWIPDSGIDNFFLDKVCACSIQ